LIHRLFRIFKIWIDIKKLQNSWFFLHYLHSLFVIIISLNNNVKVNSFKPQFVIPFTCTNTEYVYKHKIYIQRALYLLLANLNNKSYAILFPLNFLRIQYKVIIWAVCNSRWSCMAENIRVCINIRIRRSLLEFKPNVLIIRGSWKAITTNLFCSIYYFFIGDLLRNWYSIRRRRHKFLLFTTIHLRILILILVCVTYLKIIVFLFYWRSRIIPKWFLNFS